MRKITRISLALGTSAALLSMSALPASAADDGGPVPPVAGSDKAAVSPTIEVPGGVISISIDTPTENAASFVMGDPSNEDRTATITVPKLTVEDLRAEDASWSVTASLSNFSDKELDRSIDVVSAKYKIVNTPVTVGNVTIKDRATEGGVDLLRASKEEVAAGSIMSVDVVGTNTASWESVVDVTVPADVLQGHYEAILTHSLI